VREREKKGLMKNESKTIKMKSAKKKCICTRKNGVQHNEVEERDRVRKSRGNLKKKSRQQLRGQ
jgi:hypothetical protein